MKHIFYLLLLSMLVLSCAKDEVVIDQRVPAFYPVQSKTVGRVLNQQGTPIADAVVELNGQQRITNSLGLFRFEKMELNGAGTQLIVRKPGYFNAFRTFIPNIPTISSVTVYMIDRPASGSFAHNTGGTVGLNGGATVTIPPNAVVTANGSTYMGEVIVSAYWLDPTDVQALSQMPGDLRGYSLEGDRVQLATYGMMVVELTDPSGNPLNLGNGLNATLTFPIDPSLGASAPGVIPLWSFNETTGYWEEDGSASVTGSNYVAEVSHFSWWNCDAPFPVVDYELCVTSQDGEPVHGAQVALTITSGNLSGRPLTTYAYTNTEGKVFGKIPINETLDIDILVGDFNIGCAFTEAYNGTIGPFSEPSFETIQIDASLEAKMVNVIGNFLNCNGDPIIDGVVVTSLASSVIPINLDGTIDVNLITCGDEVEIVAYDFSETKQSPSVTYQTLNQINNIILEDYSICDNLDEYITVDYNGTNEVFPNPTIFDLKGVNLSASLPESSVELYWFSLPQSEFSYRTTSTVLFGFVNVVLNSATTPGYLEGTYSGDVTVTQSNPPETVSVSGTFRVKTQ